MQGKEKKCEAARPVPGLREGTQGYCTANQITVISETSKKFTNIKQIIESHDSNYQTEGAGENSIDILANKERKKGSLRLHQRSLCVRYVRHSNREVKERRPEKIRQFGALIFQPSTDKRKEMTKEIQSKATTCSGLFDPQTIQLPSLAVRVSSRLEFLPTQHQFRHQLLSLHTSIRPLVHDSIQTDILCPFRWWSRSLSIR